MDTAFGPSGLFLSTSQCARLVIGVMVTGQCVQSITLPGPPVTILSVRGHQAGQSINTVTGTVTIPCTVGSSPPPPPGVVFMVGPAGPVHLTIILALKAMDLNLE